MHINVPTTFVCPQTILITRLAILLPVLIKVFVLIEDFIIVLVLIVVFGEVLVLIRGFRDGGEQCSASVTPASLA